MSKKKMANMDLCTIHAYINKSRKAKIIIFSYDTIKEQFYSASFCEACEPWADYMGYEHLRVDIKEGKMTDLKTGEVNMKKWDKRMANKTPMRPRLLRTEQDKND